MYVGRNHTATITTRNVLSFDCVHCRQRASAIVIGVGQGRGHSPFMLDDSGAKDRAASSAEVNSRENAEQLLKLARCPNCHERDEGAVRSRKLKTIFAAAVGFTFLLLMGIGLDAVKSSSHGLWIFGPVAVLFSAFFYRAESAKWANVDRRVEFIEDPSLKKC